MANINTSGTFSPRTTYTISLPFNISNNGKIAIIQDNDPKAWKDKVVSLLSIKENERIWYRYYGAGIDALLFESGNLSAGEVATAIQETFIKWLPELTLVNVTTDYDQTNGYLTINIIYEIPTGEQDSVKIVKASLTPSGENIEVI